MFRNIVSNLSLSPAAGSQLTFYWRRLKREQLTRQLSMGMAAVLVVLQVAIVIAPPDAATASSPNDIIPGGIAGDNHPQLTALQEYDKKVTVGTGKKAHKVDSQFKDIMDHYGITRADIDATKHGTLNSNNHHLKSIGRDPHSALDEPVSIQNVVYHVRPLYTWDDNHEYDVIEGRRAVDNRYFAIMYGCGNLVLTDLTPDKETIEVIHSPTTKKEEAAPAPVVTTPTATAPAVTTPVAPAETPTPAPTEETPVVVGTATFVKHKKASLISIADGSITDANNATAKADDTIEYTLTTENTGTGDGKFTPTENLNDILEYADVTETRGGVLVNGTLSWPEATIKAGSSYITSFRVRVKSPIPTTPRSTSDPGSYDLRMDNVYGELVSTHLAIPADKQIEVASASLPQTGAGTTSLIVFTLVAAIAYFYYRNRQLVSEVAILRGDYHGHGGGQ